MVLFLYWIRQFQKFSTVFRVYHQRLINLFNIITERTESEVMTLGEMCVLKLIYWYVAVFRFCAVRRVIIIFFFLLFYNYSTYDL